MERSGNISGLQNSIVQEHRVLGTQDPETIRP